MSFNNPLSKIGIFSILISLSLFMTSEWYESKYYILVGQKHGISNIQNEITSLGDEVCMESGNKCSTCNQDYVLHNGNCIHTDDFKPQKLPNCTCNNGKAVPMLSIFNQSEARKKILNDSLKIKKNMINSIETNNSMLLASTVFAWLGMGLIFVGMLQKG